MLLKISSRLADYAKNIPNLPQLFILYLKIPIKLFIIIFTESDILGLLLIIKSFL